MNEKKTDAKIDGVARAAKDVVAKAGHIAADVAARAGHTAHAAKEQIDELAETGKHSAAELAKQAEAAFKETVVKASHVAEVAGQKVAEGAHELADKIKRR